MKSKPYFHLILFSLLMALAHANSFAQSSEINEIKAQRESSNSALKAFDEELNNTFMTEDVLITTGAGMLISGKEGLAKYVPPIPGTRMYWTRTPDEVIVNPETQLAWETGTWEGYVEGATESVVGGKYSAQWTKKSGTWLIQSQLFVTLPNE
jgi:ketosteroid isomerase-like protein